MKQNHTIKILGYTINAKNNLDNHITALYGKITHTYHQIKGAMPFLDKKNKKLILEAMLKGKLSLTLPLTLNQTEKVKDRVDSWGTHI